MVLIELGSFLQARIKTENGVHSKWRRNVQDHEWYLKIPWAIYGAGLVSSLVWTGSPFPKLTVGKVPSVWRWPARISILTVHICWSEINLIWDARTLGFVIYLPVKTDAFIFGEKGEERLMHTSLSFDVESRRQLIPFNKCSLRHSLTGIKDIFINFLYI